MESAVAGFSHVVDEYVAGRPGYPAAAAAWLADTLELHEGGRVIDLAAGTGAMTSVLSAVGLAAVAVEPLPEMRDALRRDLPELPMVGAAAAALPLADRSADAIVVASAMHWFSTPAVVAELGRVAGALAVVFNVRDDSVDWVRALSEIGNRRRGSVPSYKSMVWREVLDASGATMAGERWFDNPMVMTAETLVARVMSISFIARLPAVDRDRIADEVRELVADQPREFLLPYRTRVCCYWLT